MDLKSESIVVSAMVHLPQESTRATLVIRGGLTARVRSSTMAAFFPHFFLFSIRVTAYGFPSFADNSNYVAPLSFNFKSCTKGYLYSQLMSG